VLELGDFDLQLAFAALGALREDLQDQQFAVEHCDLERPLQVALLRRAERDVEDGDAGAAAPDQRGQFVDLATAQIKRSIGPLAPGAEFADDGVARRGGQLARFFERVGRLVAG
jgi:hypothetical protein